MAELLSDTDWDPVSDISTNHLSFLMMMGLPKRFFKKDDIKQRVRDVEHALSSVSGVDEDVVRNRVVGCFAGGYTIPDAVKLTTPPSIVNFDRTVDVLIEIKKLKIAENVSENQNRRLFAKLDCSETHLGYARLRVENAELSPTLSGGHESVIFDEESSKYFVSSKYHRENSTIDGADNKLKQESVDQKYQYNQSVTFPCVTWPKCAEDWITRPRNGKWLSELLAESIASRGCHVIPLSHPNSSSHDTEWKISFEVAEKLLAEEAVTEDQRRCFVFFLLLTRQQTQNIKSSLEFQHYLTMFYNACEKLSISLWAENPGYCLLYMIDNLIQCLRHKNLQHYFIPENNLIDFMNEEEIAENLEMFEKLRTNVLSPFLSFTDHHVFGFQCSHTPFPEMMKSVIDDITTRPQNKEQNESSIYAFSSTLFNVAHALVHENTQKKVFEAVNYLIELHPFFLRFDESLNSLSTFIDLFGQQLETVQKARSFYEEALKRSEDHSELLNVRGNLACLLHASSYEYESGSDERRELLHRAEVLFRDHLKSEDAPAGSKIDYINFLYMQNRHKDVVCRCSKLIAEHDSDEESMNAYSHLELEAVDKNLRREIEANGYINAPSLSFAYYFMIQSICQTDDKGTSGKPALHQFDNFCSKCPNSSSFGLLGYTYMSFSKWKEAIGCFKRAAQSDDGYVLKDELVKECESKI